MIIAVGSMMVRQGALLPESLVAVSEAYSSRWRLYTGLETPEILGQSVRAEGWTCFFLGALHSAFAIGSLGESSVGKALHRLLRKAEPTAFNCIEVTDIAAHRWSGVSFVVVSGHWRHFQRSGVLESQAVRSEALCR